MQELGRRFRVWDFRVSHDQLLLRSPKTSDEPRNFDLIFVGVEYVGMPTKLPELRIVDTTEDDVRAAERLLAREVPKEWVFVLESQGRRGLIVAAAMKAFENDLGFLESSLEKF
jgi:hypothetical protein